MSEDSFFWVCCAIAAMWLLYGCASQPVNHGYGGLATPAMYQDAPTEAVIAIQGQPEMHPSMLK